MIRPHPRVALYSHDTLGLGHVRRNLALAAAVRDAEADPDVLVLAGAPEASGLPRPDRCDVVTLPALCKDDAGRYASRHVAADVDEVTRWRRDVLTAALTSFDPDVLIVDRHARGFHGELEPALETLADRTRTVLGLRDVLDAPVRVRREWAAQRTDEALARWYDEVWVYGDAKVHDPLDAAGLSLPREVHHTGYLAAGRPRSWDVAELDLGTAPTIVGLVGGGQDGGALATAFAQAPLPHGVRALIVAGPQMPDATVAELERLAADRPALRVERTVPDGAALIRRATAVVSMGGANTVAEILASDTPALVVPRVRPRVEQLLRAEQLAAHDHLDLLDPDAATPAAIGSWIAGVLPRGRHRRHGLALDGLAWVRDRVDRLVADRNDHLVADRNDRLVADRDDHLVAAPDRSVGPAPVASTAPLHPVADHEVSRVAV